MQQLDNIEPQHGIFIETKTGNKVCSNAVIYGGKKIKLEKLGIIENDVIIRADLTSKTEMGKHIIIKKGAIIRPPFNSMHLS